MKELTLEELKQIQLNILDNVHEFCQRNNITYFLSYGTLLGAVRHKGYIPWDDDIDICMPRPDYMKFAKLYKDEKYSFHCPEKDTDFVYIYGKVSDDSTVIDEETYHPSHLGVNIDVFPIDGLSNDINVAKRHYDYIARINDFVNVKKIKFLKSRPLHRNILLAIYKTVICLVPFSFLIKKITGIMKKYDYTNSKYVGELCFGNSRRVLKKELFNEVVLAEFEKRLYYVPAGYDKWLRIVFGDYTQLPPEKDRVTHHAQKAYRK